MEVETFRGNSTTRVSIILGGKEDSARVMLRVGLKQVIEKPSLNAKNGTSG